MAKLALIYGMRLLPEEDLGEVKDATVVLKNGKTARVTMHLIEGRNRSYVPRFDRSVFRFVSGDLETHRDSQRDAQRIRAINGCRSFRDPDSGRRDCR
jgi:hypothetical protein